MRSRKEEMKRGGRWKEMRRKRKGGVCNWGKRRMRDRKKESKHDRENVESKKEEKDEENGKKSLKQEGEGRTEVMD